MIDSSIEVLNRVYEIAERREDTTLMVDVADRLMVLYQLMKEKAAGRNPIGFGLIDGEE